MYLQLLFCGKRKTRERQWWVKVWRAFSLARLCGHQGKKMEEKAHHVGCVRRETALTFPDRCDMSTISVLPARL